MKDDSARDKAMDKLVAKQLRAGLKPGSESCPNAEILAAYVERTLAPRERASCETHLARCLGCQALVAELVRLSEDEGPAVFQTAAGSPSRAAAAPRLRWAWAGSALAAILVGGLWYTGEFRSVLQQTPETTRQIQNSKANKPATPSPAATEYDSNVPSPPAPESRRDQENISNGNKNLDQVRPPASSAAKTEGPRGSPSTVGGLGGTSAHRESAVQSQDKMTIAPPPAPAADRFEPSRNGVIATPSERARLAKPGPGVGGRVGSGIGGGMGQGVGEGVAGGSAGGIASGASSNSTSAEKAKRATSPAPYNAPAQLSRPARKAVNGAADSIEPAHREAHAKDEAASMASTTSTLRDKEQAKQEAAASPPVNAATETVEVQAEPANPQWRVGRRGLIQKSDSNGQWKKRKSGVKTDLNEIAFSSPDVGWAVGQAGTILRTTDSGTTWTKLPSPTAEDLVHITAISNREASVVTRGGQTFKTTDGGKTWGGRQ